MSEARKRLIEEMRKSSEEYTKRLVKYEPLSGMSKIEGLERKTEEARKEEQRIKEQYKSEVEGALYVIRKDFNTLIEDEKRAVEIYEKAVNTYGTFGWRIIFGNILRDEKEHLEKLKICLQSIEDTYKRTGEIKSL